MENENIDNNYLKEYNTENTAKVNNNLTSPISYEDQININSSAGLNTSFELEDNININNEMNIINEQRKLNIFTINEEQPKNEDKIEDSNQIKYKDNDRDEDKIEVEKISEEEKELFSFKRGSLINDISNVKIAKIKSLRTSGHKPQFISTRNSVLPKSITLGKNRNSILRKTLYAGNDFNKMRRISITNFNQINNKINANKNFEPKKSIRNSRNYIKYENMFLDDEIFLKAPGSFPDEDEGNYLLKLNFLHENFYSEEDNISNNDYMDKPPLRQTNSISYNSNLDKNLRSKYLSKKSSGGSFDKIEEEDDKEEVDTNQNKILEKTENENDKYVDEEKEIPGKNILYAENVKKANNFEEGKFSKSLVSFENESKIVYMSLNLFIKKIALYNFRIFYPELYKAFLQQYSIFLSVPMFIEKIVQAFELYYNKNNKITTELIDLLNKVISENYEKIKDDLILTEKLKNFYSFMKEYIISEIDLGLGKDIDNIYYILFESDSEEDIDYSRHFLQRQKSNSIFFKSKNIYSNLFNKMKTEKINPPKKKKMMMKFKTESTLISYRYFYIFNHDEMEIAEYLTCISYQMMRNINQSELLNKNFISKEKLVKAPNVMKMIDRFNKLVLFIIEDIFSYDDKKTRCQAMEKWIDVAIKLQELHNYNDLVMINTCFVNYTLNILKLTFKKLSNKYKTIIKQMNDFCSSKECYLNIRKLIYNSKGIPYIPYLGIILKEIINIEEMKYIVGENNINFSKMVKLYNVINKFNEFKKTKFSFAKSKELDILRNLKPKTENELEELARQIEPKLKIFADRGNKKRLTNTDKYYYEKKMNEPSKINK